VFYREAKRLGGKGTERVYYVIYKRDGKGFEEKAGRQYADAMTPARAATIRGELLEGKRKTRKQKREAKRAEKWTLNKLWQEYKSQRPDLKGLVTDENRFNLHIKPRLGDKEPKKLVQLEIDRLRINLSKTHKPQTVKHVLGLLKRIVRFGVNKGLCEPLSFHIEMPKVNNLVTEDLSPGQLSVLVEAIDKDEDQESARIMKVALFSGLRRGEIFRLQWRDVDFDKGFIHIRDPKGGPSQTVPLNDMTRGVLLEQPKRYSGLVFPGRGGKVRRLFNRRFVQRLRTAGALPEGFRPLHGLRHTYASALASSGKVDLYVLQKLLTHKTMQMTQRYAHLRDEALRDASNVASDVFDGIAKGSKEYKKNEG
jgi:integrase